MPQGKYRIGMIGLGTMGKNLLLNMADKGIPVIGYDLDEAQVGALLDESREPVDGKLRQIGATAHLEELVASLVRPRVAMMMIPTGEPVEQVIETLAPLLDRDDIIVDGGNSHFRDTERRMRGLRAKGLHLLGVGISGGKRGARIGPSIMPGGNEDAYARVAPVFEEIAAKFRGEPCVAYLGPGGAGHYVKMVHNGIEYGLMQLIAESYDLLKRGFGYDTEELHATFEQWNQGELESYLIEITANIFNFLDEESGEYLVELIIAQARQKGTGRWASQDAMELGVPIPTMDTAVLMRSLSALADLRESLSERLRGPGPDERRGQEGRIDFEGTLRRALYAAFILTYTQGLHQLSVASKVYAYDLSLETIVRIWRNGCIIRAALLEDLLQAYREQPEIGNLLHAESIRGMLNKRQGDLRAVVQVGTAMGIPVPGFMSALGYYDAIRSAWLPANLIQAQRDYFGAHTYRRLDIEGVFHTEWVEEL